MGYFKTTTIDPGMTPEQYANRYSRPQSATEGAAQRVNAGTAQLATQESPQAATASLPQPRNASLLTLASAMRLEYAADAAAVRAVDRAIETLDAGLEYEFDGTELRVQSSSRAKEGLWQVSDGESCTCESSKRPWCRHRMMFRLLLAYAAMANPARLRWLIVEQCADPTIVQSVARVDNAEYGRRCAAVDELFA